MKGTMTIIPPVGRIEKRELSTAPTYPSLKAAVGGYIETVPHLTCYGDDNAVAFCDEEGKIKGLPINDRATKVWRRSIGMDPQDVLVGNVVVITGDDEMLEAL